MLRRLFGKKRPTAVDAARRLAVLTVQIHHGIAAIAPRHVLDQLKEAGNRDTWSTLVRELQAENRAAEAQLREAGLWEHMMEDERLFVATPLIELTEQQRINNSWLMEGAGCLLWALGDLDRLPEYDEQMNPDLLERAPDYMATEVAQQAALRPTTEIDAARDIAELWHWRSRTRRLQEEGGHEVRLPEGFTFPKIIAMAAESAGSAGHIPGPIAGDFPAFGKPYRDATPEEYASLTSIVMERHRALNWLAGYAPGHQWDKTPTNT